MRTEYDCLVEFGRTATGKDRRRVVQSVLQRLKVRFEGDHPGVRCRPKVEWGLGCAVCRVERDDFGVNPFAR